MESYKEALTKIYYVKVHHQIEWFEQDETEF